MLETLEYFVNQMDSYYKPSMESKQPERYGKINLLLRIQFLINFNPIFAS